MKDQEKSAPLVLEKSAVSFVLMGPVGDHRGVLARSNHDNVNLVGLDNPMVREFTTNRYNGFFSVVFGRQRDIHVVHTKPMAKIYSFTSDPRNTYLSFAWEGSAIGSDRDRIKEIFSSMAPDLLAALATGSKSSIEWQLAGLLLVCEKTTEIRLAKVKGVRWFVGGLAMVYLLLLGFSLGSATMEKWLNLFTN